MPKTGACTHDATCSIIPAGPVKENVSNEDGDAVQVETGRQNKVYTKTTLLTLYCNMSIEIVVWQPELNTLFIIFFIK